MESQIEGISEAFLTSIDRSRLVGLCRKLTGDGDVAEDLAQESLLVAWQHVQSLRDPMKKEQWIAGIARNISLRWLRQHGRDQRHTQILHSDQDEATVAGLENVVADDFDIEVVLEHKELVDLLDRAMAFLLADTRTVLVKHYVEESPLGEIAEHLGTNVSAIATRLQRGRLAMRKVFKNEMAQEADVYTDTFIVGQTPAWETTSLWCHLCGRHRFLGQRQPERGLFYLKCPLCSPGDEVVSLNELSVLRGFKSYKPAYARLGKWCYEYYYPALRAHRAVCDTCGRMIEAKISVAKEIHSLPWVHTVQPHWTSRDDTRLISVICHHCMQMYCTTLSGLLLFLPQTRKFHKHHPRMRLLPYREVEFADRPAIVTTYESLTDSACFTVIADDETFEVLRIEGDTER